MLWAVICIDKPGTAAAREELLKVHREYLTTKDDIIFFSGPLQSDDASQALGSLFVLNVPGRKEAQAYIDAEPFNNAGIFVNVRISRMRKGRFQPQLADRL